MAEKSQQKINPECTRSLATKLWKTVDGFAVAFSFPWNSKKMGQDSNYEWMGMLQTIDPTFNLLWCCWSTKRSCPLRLQWKISKTLQFVWHHALGTKMFFLSFGELSWYVIYTWAYKCIRILSYFAKSQCLYL